MDIEAMEARHAELLIAVYAGPGPARDEDVVELLELERQLDTAKAEDEVTRPRPDSADAMDPADATSSAAAAAEPARIEPEDLLWRRVVRSRVAAIVFGGLLLLQCASMIVADAVPVESSPTGHPEWCRAAALSMRNDPVTAARLQQGCEAMDANAAEFRALPERVSTPVDDSACALMARVPWPHRNDEGRNHDEHEPRYR